MYQVEYLIGNTNLSIAIQRPNLVLRLRVLDNSIQTLLTILNINLQTFLLELIKTKLLHGKMAAIKALRNNGLVLTNWTIR